MFELFSVGLVRLFCFGSLVCSIMVLIILFGLSCLYWFVWVNDYFVSCYGRIIMFGLRCLDYVVGF